VTSSKAKKWKGKLMSVLVASHVSATVLKAKIDITQVYILGVANMGSDNV
jgi:hypothetical protein